MAARLPGCAGGWDGCGVVAAWGAATCLCRDAAASGDRGPSLCMPCPVLAALPLVVPRVSPDRTLTRPSPSSLHHLPPPSRSLELRSRRGADVQGLLVAFRVRLVLLYDAGDRLERRPAGRRPMKYEESSTYRTARSAACPSRAWLVFARRLCTRPWFHDSVATLLTELLVLADMDLPCRYLPCRRRDRGQRCRWRWVRDTTCPSSRF